MADMARCCVLNAFGFEARSWELNRYEREIDGAAHIRRSNVCLFMRSSRMMTINVR
jgi:hypothetical protein